MTDGMKSMLCKIILYLWQLPQNLLGLIVYVVNIKSVSKKYNLFADCCYYTAKHVSDTGISLGKYIFIDGDNFIMLNSILHEKGHQKQSLYLGWLYLFVIGIPSAIGNLWDRIAHKKWSHWKRDQWYYSQSWEAWADKLGKVKR